MSRIAHLASDLVHRSAIVPLVCALGVGLIAACGTPVPDLASKPLDGYVVRYRVTAPGQRTRFERLEVRRPYDGRIETGTAGRTTSGRITSRTHFWQIGRDGRVRFGVVRAPGAPARDASVTALRDAVRAGRAEAIGSDRVLGVRCAWYAYAKPAPAPLARPTATDRVESCVDAAGVVLREVWTLDGKPARVLEAVEIDRDAPSRKRFLEGRDPTTEKVTDPKGAELLQVSTIVRDVAAGRVGSPFTFTEPKGWKRDRVALVGTTVQGARATQYLSRTYLDGHRLVVLDTASGAEFTPPWDTGEGTRIDIGAGEGRIVFFADRVEVRLLSRLGYARVVAPSREVAFEFIRGLAG